MERNGNLLNWEQEAFSNNEIAASPKDISLYKKN